MLNPMSFKLNNNKIDKKQRSLKICARSSEEVRNNLFFLKLNCNNYTKSITENCKKPFLNDKGPRVSQQQKD